MGTLRLRLGEERATLHCRQPKTTTWTTASDLFAYAVEHDPQRTEDDLEVEGD